MLLQQVNYALWMTLWQLVAVATVATHGSCHKRLSVSFIYENDSIPGNKV